MMLYWDGPLFPTISSNQSVQQLAMTADDECWVGLRQPMADDMMDGSQDRT